MAAPPSGPPSSAPTVKLQAAPDPPTTSATVKLAAPPSPGSVTSLPQFPGATQATGPSASVVDVILAAAAMLSTLGAAIFLFLI
jgi:hypothetical protein